MHQTKRFLATLQAVSEFVAQLDDDLAAIPDAIRITLTLAVQELCVNIVEHAYNGEAGYIEVDLDWTGNDMRMVFHDQATKAYEPKPLEVPADPFDIPERGRGLFIIYQVFDRVDYVRLPAGNRWELVKTIAEV